MVLTVEKIRKAIAAAFAAHDREPIELRDL
jgi:hypothetical protein